MTPRNRSNRPKFDQPLAGDFGLVSRNMCVELRLLPYINGVRSAANTKLFPKVGDPRQLLAPRDPKKSVKQVETSTNRTPATSGSSPWTCVLNLVPSLSQPANSLERTLMSPNYTSYDIRWPGTPTDRCVTLVKSMNEEKCSRKRNTTLVVEALPHISYPISYFFITCAMFCLPLLLFNPLHS